MTPADDGTDPTRMNAATHRSGRNFRASKLAGANRDVFVISGGHRDGSLGEFLSDLDAGSKHDWVRAALCEPTGRIPPGGRITACWKALS